MDSPPSAHSRAQVKICPNNWERSSCSLRRPRRRPDHYDLSIAFHSLIVKGAASPRINVALRAMSALVPGNFFEEVPEAVEVESRGLAAITRAMKQGDGEKAAAEYVKMMRNVGNKVAQLFRERSLFESVRGDGLTARSRTGDVGRDRRTLRTSLGPCVVSDDGGGLSRQRQGLHPRVHRHHWA